MRRQTFYAFLISFLLLGAVIVLNRLAFKKMEFNSFWVNHTREVIKGFENVSNEFISAQIYTPTFDSIPQKEFFIFYKQNTEKLKHDLLDLKNLVRDNDEQTQLVDSISVIIKDQFPILVSKNIEEIIQSGQGNRLQVFSAVNQMIERAIGHEEELLAGRRLRLEESIRFINLFTNIFAILAILIILVAFISNLVISRKGRWLEGFLESILNTTRYGVVHYKVMKKKGSITDFRIEYVNKAIKELLNINPPDVIGKNLRDFDSFVDGSDVKQKFIKTFETGIPQETEVFYNKNGMAKWFYISIAKMEDGITLSFNDITQLKKYEEVLKSNIEELKRSNSELEQYAYVASHDLQEPLRKIRSFGSFLQQGESTKMDEKGQQQLQKMMNAAERMSLLIKDILSFSSLKKQDLFVPTDLNKTLSIVLEDLDLVITQKNARVNIETLPVIDAIPLQMNQLFYNLINNSLKFGKPDERLVINITCSRSRSEEIKAHGLSEVNAYFKITVGDNGIGFDQAYAEQIFGLFKRLNDRQNYPGSGIGLALCRKVVLNHNGEIWASGKENEGATFTILLPEKHIAQ